MRGLYSGIFLFRLFIFLAILIFFFPFHHLFIILFLIFFFLLLHIFIIIFLLLIKGYNHT